MGYMGSVWVVWGANYGVWGGLGAKYRVWGGLGCQIQGLGWLGVPNKRFGVAGGAKYRVLGQLMAERHQELNPRPPDPKPCGQPLCYMGSVWLVWGAKYDVLMVWNANTRFWVVWGAKCWVLGGLG